MNHPTVGKVIGGAQVEREIAWNFNEKKSFLLSIHNPDFATSCRLAGAINADFQQKIAGAVDSGTVKVEVPESYAGNVVELITRVERLKIIPDTVARVVLDERTGTIVIGENVRISTVAISHGNLSIVVKERKEVSQPFPFAPSPAGSGETNLDSEEGLTLAPGGQTVITPDSEVVAEEEKSKLILISSGTTINELVRALNAIGVSPRDLIAIFQSMKAAGVLQAELEII